jgi:hypothetical protein
MVPVVVAAVTVSAMGVDAVRPPEVPVMMTVVVPAGAVPLTENVTTLVVVAGLTVNAAVTPLGRPLAASVTEPLNGLTSVIVMVEVVLLFWAIVSAPGEGASEKLPDVVPTVTLTTLEVLVAYVVDPP